ncbi:MAG: methylenetetrahydrofolate reductase [Thaumarchaeota archaeon]|nr:methylenetetrahydrofolate reductase [Nitrososphaerota archaeon]
MLGIVYEANPPRAEDGADASGLLEAMSSRLGRVIGLADAVLVTDGVLGTRRVGVLDACAAIAASHPRAEVMISLRTRDRTYERLAGDIAEAARVGVSAVLLVRGDPPQYAGARDTNLYPGAALSRLRAESRTCGVRMVLSLPAEPDPAGTRKKLAARPDAFVTQVIASEAQAAGIVEEMAAHGIGVTPCVMVPSEKNAPSARALGLDWSAYEGDCGAFVRRIHSLAGGVLVTSPRDLAAAEAAIASAR